MLSCDERGSGCGRVPLPVRSSAGAQDFPGNLTALVKKAFAAAGRTCIHRGAELKLIHMCVHASVCLECLECMETRPTSCSTKLQMLDSRRITHEVVRATASWQDLGPRAGSSDATRLLRRLRCDTVGWMRGGARAGG